MITIWWTKSGNKDLCLATIPISSLNDGYQGYHRDDVIDALCELIEKTDDAKENILEGWIVVKQDKVVVKVFKNLPSLVEGLLICGKVV